MSLLLMSATAGTVGAGTCGAEVSRTQGSETETINTPFSK